MSNIVERKERRAAILRLQESAMALPDAFKLDVLKDTPVRHIFAPGVYAREMTIPEGVTIIGKIHRHPHLNVLSMGRVQVFTEGGGVEEMQAPYSFVSTPGTKRVVRALETTVWTTIHPTELTDLAQIEAHVIAPDYTALEAPE